MNVLLRALLVGAALLAGVAVRSCVVAGQFARDRDAFDEIRDRFERVHAQNCHIQDVNELFLPNDTVTHVPNIKRLNIDPVFPNRTNLLHVHNMAVSKAFFYSFILQRAKDNDEPGFMYYFMSVISDVAANRFINASAVYYAPNMSFTPSYKGFFNKTMPLFAPRAFRSDDFNDPYHLEGTSTLNTIEAVDLGAIPPDSPSLNYSSDYYRINEWYSAWLPDLTRRQDSKTTYTAQITDFYGNNETFVWHGPPAANDNPGPVKWLRPYFDCGRSDKWVYGATSPIPDIYPRHTQWRHIEIPRYVAISVMELDFERLDLNQCPIGPGNPGPNYFAGTARCKNETTDCEPVHGYGFRRGGYQCRCKPGYRRPRQVRNPYHGELIERASRDEYTKGYHCEKIGYIGVLTQNVVRVPQDVRAKLIGRFANHMAINGMSSSSNATSRLDPLTIINRMKLINSNNCVQKRRENPDTLRLGGNVVFGKEQQLENEARMAVRLANFVSGFMQIVDPKDLFAEFRVPDKPLTADQLIGEVMSIVIGDQKVVGAGIYFDYKAFTERNYFGAYAWRQGRNERKYFVDDTARFAGTKTDRDYLTKDWYQHLRTKWSANLDDLVTFTTKIQIRFNSTGHSAIKYDHYPLQYKAADVKDGYWTSPYFDCGGYHNSWIVTYAVPFFGWDALRARLQFKGVVAVNIELEQLEINQCPDYSRYPENNAFESTHKCDRKSSRCVPIMGRGFDQGGYKCECNQGYEYPYNDPITYFDGQIVEAEFEKLVDDKPSRFERLRCRLAGTSKDSANISLLLLGLVLVHVYAVN